MPRPKPVSTVAGRAVLSYTAAGKAWSVSTPLLDGTPRSMSSALRDLILQLCRKAEPELHPPREAKDRQPRTCPTCKTEYRSALERVACMQSHQELDAPTAVADH